MGGMIVTGARDAGAEAPAAERVIDVRDLRMRYGSTDVLQGISFAANRGEVLALLGPNGAGKTTTIEILEGFRRRSAGVVRVLGADPATAGRPELLFLDEPTAGFDPAARREFHDLVHRLADEDDTTILLTTHDLDEAEKLADRSVYPITALPGWLQAVGQLFPVYWPGLGMRSVFLPGPLGAVELGQSWRHPETFGVLGLWAVAGPVLAPMVLRRMARRESGSAVAERRAKAMQRVG